MKKLIAVTALVLTLLGIGATVHESSTVTVADWPCMACW